MSMAKQLPRIGAGGPLADGALGVVGGVMGGIGGFAGSIPTLWCKLQGMDKDAQRAVIQNFNLATLAVTFAIYLGRGIVTREMLPMFAIVAPALLIPGLLGARRYAGIGEAGFRRLVLGLLILSAVRLLVSAVPKLLLKVCALRRCALQSTIRPAGHTTARKGHAR